MVDENDPDLAPESAVDETGTIDHPDPVPDGESGTRCHQAGVARGDGDGDTRRHHGPLPSGETDTVAGIEIYPAITRVSVCGDRQARIQLLERDAHSVDYGSRRMFTVAAIKRRERQAHRRTILSMLETTPATVARPLAPGQAAEPIPDLDFDWRPHPLDRTVTSHRTYRWSIVVGAVVIGVGILVGARLLLAMPAHKASVRHDEYVAVTAAFAAALDRLDGAATVTDPLAAADFAEASESLRTTAEEPLPWVLPLVPLGPDLPPVRSKMLEVSDTAATLSDEITQAAAYRQASDEIFALPLLPTEVPAELIDPAARALADMQAASEAAVAGLDTDPAYENYRSRVADALAALPDWINRYLIALRRADTATATTLLVDAQAQRTLIQSELDTVFSRVDADADAAIAMLRAGVEAVRVLAG